MNRTGVLLVSAVMSDVTLLLVELTFLLCPVLACRAWATALGVGKPRSFHLTDIDRVRPISTFWWAQSRQSGHADLVLQARGAGSLAAHDRSETVNHKRA